MVGLIVAGCWQGMGITMTIMLAGIRGNDADIWRAAKIDGVPMWKSYFYIVIPMMRGAVGTALLLQVVTIVRTYDLVVAMAADRYQEPGCWRSMSTTLSATKSTSAEGPRRRP